ncbi:MAG: ATP-binding protein [Betaproteobacteria bacterium]|nr:ATP-binding protein [Betaproteobacteria bacterium]
MRTRHYWLDLIHRAWQSRSILWLAGVRRVGKTTLCRSVPGTEYFDCELPRVRSLLTQPEAFLDGVRGRSIVLDEVHRLANPSELLKIAADHYRDVRILATGSSMLGASSRFRDTLAGRKAEVWLTPMMSADLEDFGQPDLGHRLLHGGLPPFFLAPEVPEREFQEWMDAYWAKDIQELFRLERRHSFQRFAELLFAQSGGVFEASRFARECEASRTTITNYLSVLEATYVVHVLRPFSTRRATEIIAAPKVFSFDTGFVCYHRGWHALRQDDLGPLWEHFVLNELHARLQTRQIRYWRDKRRHEVDFVLARRGAAPVAIECKWSASGFDPAGLLAFRRQHAEGRNYVVATDVGRRYKRDYEGREVNFVNLAQLIEIAGSREPRSGG